MPKTPRQIEGQEARKIAHHAILNLRKYIGAGACAEFLRERADAIERADLSLEKMDGFLERREREKSPMQREFEARMKRLSGRE